MGGLHEGDGGDAHGTLPLRHAHHVAHAPAGEQGGIEFRIHGAQHLGVRAQADVPCPAGGGSGNVQFLFSGGVSGKGS